MTLRSKSLILLLGLALAQAGFAADTKDPGKFKPGPANSYPNHQTSEKVTVAVVPFDTDELTRDVFGKADPNKHGLLPVLVVIQNDTGKALRLENMTAELTGPDRQKVEATPADEVRFIGGGKRPKDRKLPYPIPRGNKKNPLEAWEFIGRAFSAKMLPPGDSANGFFYFQSGLRPQSMIYLTGMREAGTERELLYFEIPIEPTR
ncbi:MAG: hypothetical protein NTY38_20355 [Acidobacteria bacterium]|nr:hypothetical protein [Acidobacteriota bacterium]